MPIAQSIIDILRSVFADISVLVVEKDTIVENVGHRQSWSIFGRIFLWQAKKEIPFFSQYIDRKSKKKNCGTFC